MLRTSRIVLMLVCRSRRTVSTDDSGGSSNENLHSILPDRDFVYTCIGEPATVVERFPAQHRNRNRRRSSRFHSRRSEPHADHSLGRAQSWSGGACLLSRILVTILRPAVGRTQDSLEEE